jgi:dynein heavy chain
VKESGNALREAFAAKIEAFRPYLPVITDLKNPGMKDRHWEELTLRLKIKLTRHLQMTMNELIEQNIMDHKDVIAEVSDKATRENILEQGKVRMEREWDDIRFKVVAYKKTGTFIIVENEEIWELLDEHLMKCISMIGSPYIKFMEREMSHWHNTLLKM